MTYAVQEDTVKKGIGLWVLRFMVCSVGFW